MKKMIWIFLVLLSPVAFAQQGNGGTPEQEEQFRKQMEDFQKQMQDQMQSLRDSLQQMQQAYRDLDWSQIDTMEFEMPEMPEIPEMPEMPPMPEMAPMPPMPDSDNESGDDTKVRIGNWNMSVENDDNGDNHVHVYKSESCDDECDGECELTNVETKFLLLDLGLNNYFGKNFSSAFPAGYESFDPAPGKSWVVNLHVVSQRLNLIRFHLWLTYGVYFELNSYKYNNNDVLVPKIDSVAFQTSDVPLEKNKLSCEYVGIPVMLRYESNPSDPEKSFHISAGGFGEYLMGAHTKTKNNSGAKNKQHDDFNLNRFRYGITARAGYGWVSLFANISLSELLVNGAGPVLYPVSGGLAFEF